METLSINFLKRDDTSPIILQAMEKEELTEMNLQFEFSDIED